MHIMEGFLPVEHALGWSLASAPFLAWGVHSVHLTQALNLEQIGPVGVGDVAAVLDLDRSHKAFLGPVEAIPYLARQERLTRSFTGAHPRVPVASVIAAASGVRPMWSPWLRETSPLVRTVRVPTVSVWMCRKVSEPRCSATPTVPDHRPPSVVTRRCSGTASSSNSDASTGRPDSAVNARASENRLSVGAWTR